MTQSSTGWGVAQVPGGLYAREGRIVSGPPRPEPSLYGVRGQLHGHEAAGVGDDQARNGARGRQRQPGCARRKCLPKQGFGLWTLDSSSGLWTLDFGLSVVRWSRSPQLTALRFQFSAFQHVSFSLRPLSQFQPSPHPSASTNLPASPISFIVLPCPAMPESGTMPNRSLLT